MCGPRVNGSQQNDGQADCRISDFRSLIPNRGLRYTGFSNFNQLVVGSITLPAVERRETGSSIGRLCVPLAMSSIERPRSISMPSTR